MLTNYLKQVNRLKRSPKYQSKVMRSIKHEKAVDSCNMDPFKYNILSLNCNYSFCEELRQMIPRRVYEALCSLKNGIAALHQQITQQVQMTASSHQKVIYQLYLLLKEYISQWERGKDRGKEREEGEAKEKIRSFVQFLLNLNSSDLFINQQQASQLLNCLSETSSDMSIPLDSLDILKKFFEYLLAPPINQNSLQGLQSKESQLSVSPQPKFSSEFEFSNSSFTEDQPTRDSLDLYSQQERQFDLDQSSDLPLKYIFILQDFGSNNEDSYHLSRYMIKENFDSNEETCWELSFNREEVDQRVIRPSCFNMSTTKVTRQ